MRTNAATGGPAPRDFFAAHAGAPFAFFLDRTTAAGPCFAGSRPCAQIVVEEDGAVRLWRDGHWSPLDGDPVDCLADFVARSARGPALLPASLAGAALPRTVGFLAYELASWADGPAVEAFRHQRRVGTPLAVLSTYDEIDAWDSSRGCAVRVRLGDSCAARGLPEPRPQPGPPWCSTPKASWQRGFERIRQAIAAGDIYQANLSRRETFEFDGDAAEAWHRLREVQPVPHGAFLDFGGFALLSNSPELFVARDGARVVTRPIKGTSARHREAGEDVRAADALRRDPKEMAEHLMIVDLERNDLGRVANTGSVRVTRFAGVESFATVHHLVSDVEATLRPGSSLADLLRATFPGGSITGAPKRRAIEILAEVESDARGPYTGAIGFFDGPDRFELAIAIRTAVSSGRRLLYSTGGGIVADSVAGREWEETELKVAALREALARGESAGARLAALS